MVEVKVCVGSSCHMKGSYQVIMTFKKMIEKLGLQDKVALKASFCMGRCLSGISMTVNDEPVENAVSYTHLSKGWPGSGSRRSQKRIDRINFVTRW